MMAREHFLPPPEGDVAAYLVYLDVRALVDTYRQFFQLPARLLQGSHLLLGGGSLGDLRRLHVGYLSQHPEDQLFPRHLQAVDANRYPCLAAFTAMKGRRPSFHAGRAANTWSEPVRNPPISLSSPQPGMYARRTARATRSRISRTRAMASAVAVGMSGISWVRRAARPVRRPPFPVPISALRIPVVGRRLMRQLVAPQDKPPCHEGLPYVLAMLPYELSAYLHVAVLPGQLEEVGQLPALSGESLRISFSTEYIRSFPSREG